MTNFGSSAIRFFTGLNPDFKLKQDIKLLLPYSDKEVKRITRDFFKMYFSDENKRVFILGINPGRFGAGITGISFTDPVNLEKICGIENTFQKRTELSSTFVYNMIGKYGGVKSFFKDFFLSAVCPVGFIQNGKNINYYDDNSLMVSSREFIVTTMKKQIDFGASKKIAICLGEGKNLLFLNKLNKECNFFEQIIPLAHPRYIMQYKRKQMGEYIDHYIKVLNESLELSIDKF